MAHRVTSAAFSLESAMRAENESYEMQVDLPEDTLDHLFEQFVTSDQFGSTESPTDISFDTMSSPSPWESPSAGTYPRMAQHEARRQKLGPPFQPTTTKGPTSAASCRHEDQGNLSDDRTLQRRGLATEPTWESDHSLVRRDSDKVSIPPPMPRTPTPAPGSSSRQRLSNSSTPSRHSNAPRATSYTTKMMSALDMQSPLQGHFQPRDQKSWQQDVDFSVAMRNGLAMPKPWLPLSPPPSAKLSGMGDVATLSTAYNESSSRAPETFYQAMVQNEGFDGQSVGHTQYTPQTSPIMSSLDVQSLSFQTRPASVNAGCSTAPYTKSALSSTPNTSRTLPPWTPASTDGSFCLDYSGSTTASTAAVSAPSSFPTGEMAPWWTVHAETTLAQPTGRGYNSVSAASKHLMQMTGTTDYDLPTIGSTSLAAGGLMISCEPHHDLPVLSGDASLSSPESAVFFSPSASSSDTMMPSADSCFSTPSGNNDIKDIWTQPSSSPLPPTGVQVAKNNHNNNSNNNNNSKNSKKRTFSEQSSLPVTNSRATKAARPLKPVTTTTKAIPRRRQASQQTKASRAVSTSTPRTPSACPPESPSGCIGFRNFTPQDSRSILRGVAPSGSSKTKARREKEAAERRQQLKGAMVRAVEAAGGRLDVLENEGFLNL